MAARVYISHSGQYLAFEEPAAGVDALRAWLEQHVGIPSSRQILMTPRGKNIKTLATDAEVYVYDKKNLSPSAELPADQEQQLPDLRDSPSPPSNATIEQWKEAARESRTWALEASDAIRSGADSIERLFFEAEVISRSVLAALENVKNYLQAANQKFDETEQWALDSIREHSDALNDWERSYNTLTEIPVRDEVASILRRPGDKRDVHQISTLSDLIHLEPLRDADQAVRDASASFKRQLEELQRRRDGLKQDTNDVEKHITQVPESDTVGLVEEAETIARRISTDYDDILKLQDEPKSLAQASRKAAAYSRDYMPTLQSLMVDVQQSFLTAQSTRNTAVKDFYAALKAISDIQSRLSSLQSDVAKLDFVEQAGLDALYRIFQLPTVYGCTLIEAARRSEWTHKMQSEVDSLHNDLSQLTEDEQRRRRKWVSSYGDFLNKELNSQVALIDIKASKPRNTWPFVEREEINAFIEDLRALEINEAIETILQRMKDLEGPVRRPRPRAFKNGSVQDLAASSTMNGDARTLQEEKVRLEEKVKASESRVRKLEDLLHRQSQSNRPPSGVFTPGGVSEYDRHTPSPGPFQKQSELPHRPSISLRRFSNAQDEKVTGQKISALEAQVQKLQSEAHEERRSSTESRDKMQEAQSVKQDLMANFEAQRQEFDEERQLMDDENHKLKIRIEELEDELDRILGSRDHLRQTHDQKLTELKTELDQARDAQRTEEEQSKLRLEDLEKDIHVHRDRTSNLERQLQECRDERNSARNQNMDLARQLRLQEDQQQDLISSLQNAHSNLSPAGSAPDEVQRLARAIEILSEGAAIHARGLDDNLQLATAEVKSLEEKVAHAESQAKNSAAKLASAEAKATGLKEALDHERNILKTVRSEANDNQAELDNLRSKLTAGETGSDALRERLTQEEHKVGELQELKYDNESTIQGLRNEIEGLRTESRAAAQRLEVLKRKLDARGDKARQLSERLFQHNDRIVRMLEQFGFSISRQDDTLLIQRASKVGASTTLSAYEGSTPMKRTMSGSVPSPHYSDPSDLETLYWTSDTETTEEESKYRSFLSALQRLDLDSTIDVVAKRYKDVENLAKKYQKDSRAYRDKAHRSQSDAHDKIAYRSFKEGDLALFLPTRNQATRPWAAFNVGAPHYFLREQDHHKLHSRDWLLARISKVEERIVDLSRSLSSNQGGASMHAEAGDAASTRSLDDENPFELSDGLRWYMIDAAEEKPGAPGTPSVGKSTVIASTVEVEAMMGRKDKAIGKSPNAAQVAKTLNKSLESRRSSSASKRSSSIKKDSSSLKDAPAPGPLTPVVPGAAAAGGSSEPVVKPSDSYPGPAREDARVFDIVREDLLQGP